MIEKVTGRTWQEEVRTRIIERLGLKQTGFPNAADGALPALTPRGYRYGRKGHPVRYRDVWFDATAWSSSWSGAAGDMYGMLADLAVFARAAGRGELLGEKARAAQFEWLGELGELAVKLITETH